MQIRLPFQDYHDGKAGGGRRLLTAFRLSTNKSKNNLSMVQISGSNGTGRPGPGQGYFLVPVSGTRAGAKIPGQIPVPGRPGKK